MPVSPANEPFRLNIIKSNSGSNILVYAIAEGCGIYLLQRIVVCTETSSVSSCRYYRPGGFFDFEIGGAQIEPNITILKAVMPAPAGSFTAFADGHYVRVDRRATTPKMDF
jgi:hypothetical protein